MKRRLSKYLPFLALVGAVVLVAALFRAISIVRAAGTDGIKVPAESFFRYLWLELMQAFKFSRYE